jgi:hypothetical protein
VDRAIREELMNAVYGRETGYRVLLEGDPQLKTAITLFPDAAKLAGIASTDSPADRKLVAKK